jgi:hypothetical protein
MHIYLKLTATDKMADEISAALNQLFDREIPLPADGEIINIPVDEVVKGMGLTVKQIATFISVLKKQ